MKLAKKSAVINKKIRRFLSHKMDTIVENDIKNLRFYQFKKTTADFFYKIYKKTDIKIEDTPHYVFAVALRDKRGVEEAEQFYRAYLEASWGRNEPAGKYDERISGFKAHFVACENNKNMPRPVLTPLISSEPMFVVDGNHRLAIWAALGKKAKVEILPPDLAMLIFSKAPEFYGSGFRDMPYQSVFLSGEKVVSGRRDDALERLKIIPPEVIRDQRILDVASNVGMSSLLAHHLGANSCLGLELSQKMVDLSTRFSMFDGRFPDVIFRRFNIDVDKLDDDIIYDTAFMFSVYNHLKEPGNLSTIAINNVAKWVVFEGHPQTEEKDYASFFKSGLFSDVKLLGFLSESVFNTTKNRPLWLCQKTI
ncbi:class I SAM-dependent methyltransferase [Pleomorphomonas carboxyditropha]|uniref:class I SAM-dependent methyltransferase n=1 Tax=Pleomorphomonas carboxyditropha TaxID=2023338 RepID=UPI0013FD5C44|nr:class I SAM-dependent methyltransferase [Pleomorphomonas carboxyditropha]